MKLFLHITSVPPGEAPFWVREQWVGLSLPLAQRKANPVTLLTSGVLSGPRSIPSRLVALFTGKLKLRSGFLVETQPAVAILASRSPEAAAWWQGNASHQLKPKRYFVFPPEVGNVSEAIAEA